MSLGRLAKANRGDGSLVGLRSFQVPPLGRHHPMLSPTLHPTPSSTLLTPCSSLGSRAGRERSEPPASPLCIVSALSARQDYPLASSLSLSLFRSFSCSLCLSVSLSTLLLSFLSHSLFRSLSLNVSLAVCVALSISLVRSLSLSPPQIGRAHV